MPGEKMEFKLVKPTEFLNEITFNKAELITEIKNRLAKYEDLVYDSTQIKEAKADRATLNAFKIAIENKRKEIKKKCLEPYEKFEKDVKEIVAIIDQPMLGIDNQLKAYENERKQIRKAEIETYYNELANKNPELKLFLPLEKIFNEKWLNATVLATNVFRELEAIIENFLNAWDIINAHDSKYRTQLLDKFIQTLSAVEVLAEEKRLKELDKKLAEAKVVPEQTLAQSAIDLQTPAKKHEIHFKVTATSNQLRLLKEFFVNNNIEYEREMEES